MKRSIFRRATLFVSALTMGASALVGLAPSAHAAAGNYVITAAGSDTTMGLLNTLMPLVDGSVINENFNPANPNTITARNLVVNPDNCNPDGSGGCNTTGVTIPGDTECPSVTWHTDVSALNGGSATSSSQGKAPFGSGSGRNYLTAEANGNAATPNAGCIDFGRSSSFPGAHAGATDTYEMWAYAIDAISWATTSEKAPALLTRADLQGIYRCSITSWGSSTLSHPGLPGNISRYYPQAGSGSNATFSSEVIGISGFNPATDTTATTNCPSAPVSQRTAHFIEENEAQAIAAADNDTAVMGYSAGLYAFQINNNINPSLDRRYPNNCIGCEKIRLGGLDTTGVTTTPIKASPLMYVSANTDYELDPSLVNESNVSANTVANNVNASGTTTYVGAANAFFGVRMLFNVTVAAQATLAPHGVGTATALVGFQDAGTGKGPFCDMSGSGSSTGTSMKFALLSLGFLTLPTRNLSGGPSNLTCIHLRN